MKPGLSTKCTTGRWKVSAKIDEARDLLRGVGGPAADHERVAREHGDRPAVEPREPGDDRAAAMLPDLEERARIDDALEDRPHVVDLAPVARHRLDQERLAPRRVVGRRDARRQLVDRGGQIGEEAPRAREGFLLARHHVVDRAVRAHGCRLLPSSSLVTFSPSARDHRRPGDEHLRDALDHQRVVARHDPRGAEARDRAEAERHDRHRARLSTNQLPAGIGRHVGVAERLDGLDRAAAAGAVDQPHDRHAQLVRHLLRHHLLLPDRRRPRRRRAP